MKQHHIVIVGGGAGGLELATRLGNRLGKKKKAKITLVDARMTHLWKPRLHEVAAGAINANMDELSYLAHGKHHHFEFMVGRMSGLDRKEKFIELAPLIHDGEEVLPTRQLHYDTLVIAVGSQTNDFGTKGAAEHCIFLDKREAAETFHQDFLNQFLRASRKPDAKCSVAIVGAGATGVELAAELMHSAEQLNQYGFKGIKPKDLSITLIEAADRVLPALSEKASAAILRQLKKRNIDVLTKEMVTEVTADNLQMKSGRKITASLKVWSAGIKAPAFLKDLDLETNRIHQIKVKPTLQSTVDEEIFAFGDCAECPRPDNDLPVPPRAQSANQQAKLLADNIYKHLQKQPLKDFVYRDKGSLISLSKASGVGDLMGNLSKDFTFEGKVARLLYTSLYRLHQVVLHGYLITGLLILRDRLNKTTGPKLKLH